MESDRLNPAQSEVLAQLGSSERPVFRPDLRDDLKGELEQAISLAIDEIQDPPLFISKRIVSNIHSCEGRYVAEQESDFEWSVPAARGTVAHKAIELLIAWPGRPTPLELVEESVARLENDEHKSIGPFLQGLAPGELAELKGLANDYVATFLETFPPLKPQWRPVAESRVRADLCGNNVTVAGMIDLSLGFARGTEAGKVLIDLKTGGPHRSHIDDLRLYALLETLKLGVPPRLLVNYYLEAGDPRTELVSEEVLWTTTKRLADAILRVVELDAGIRDPELRPGSLCRFCPGLSDCEPGTSHVNQAKSDD